MRRCSPLLLRLFHSTHLASAPPLLRVLIRLPRQRAYRFLDRFRVYLLTHETRRRDWRALFADREEREQRSRDMPKAAKPAHYAVRKGKKPGIYATWAECEEQVKGFADAQFKKFNTRSGAEEFIAQGGSTAAAAGNSHAASSSKHIPAVPPAPDPSARSTNGPLSPLAAQAAAEGFDIADGHLVVHTDGSARGNGKVGSVAGLGVWWGRSRRARESNLAEALPGPVQTNNRAELLAIIRAIETCPFPDLPLEIRTDSSYSIKCLTVYLPGWMRNNWRSSTGEPVKNKEMIVHLVALMNRRGRGAAGAGGVRFTHVRGHQGVDGNEEADRLANRGAEMPRVRDRTDWLTLEDAEAEHRELTKSPAQWVAGLDKLDVEFNIDSDAFWDDEDIRQLEKEIAES